MKIKKLIYVFVLCLMSQPSNASGGGGWASINGGAISADDEDGKFVSVELIAMIFNFGIDYHQFEDKSVLMH